MEKEVSDLVVIFDDHVLLFSDKHIHFGDSGNLLVDWSRWERAAVTEGAKQLFGAERWIRNHPNRLFVDRACSQPLPISLPSPEKIRFHRILVVRGAAQRCRHHLGGSGSLIVASEAKGDARLKPFMVCQPNPTKGFVHVIDETALDILLGYLDTAADFIAYLCEKETLFTSGLQVHAAGEEELLGVYLQKIGPDGTHGFFFDSELTGISVAEGFWQSFLESPQFQARISANDVSYNWDRLVDKFSHHIINRTQHYTTGDSVSDNERLVRWMAREDRTRRRMLADKLVSMIEETRPGTKRAACIHPSRSEDPYWVFLVLPEPDWAKREDYREVRRELLVRYCSVVRLLCSDATDICGIATGLLTSAGNSEDALYIDTRIWTSEMEHEARFLHEEFGLFKTGTAMHQKVHEFPIAERHQPIPKPPLQTRRTGRNDLCPCGSGKKHKQCCLRRQ